MAQSLPHQVPSAAAAAAPAAGVRGELRAKLHELEAWAVGETGRLEDLVSSLQAENDRLREALRAVAQAVAKVEVSPDAGSVAAASPADGKEETGVGAGSPEDLNKHVPVERAAEKSKCAGDLPEQPDEDATLVALAAAPAETPLPIGLLFPGQGTQYVRMMSTVKDLPAVKEMLEKAVNILGFDVLQLCLRGPESKLEETANCHAAIFLASLAGVEKLRADNEEAVTRCQAVAGPSLGEYTALCIAGVFSFEDGLKLVQLRAEAMQEVSKMGRQASLSLAGLDKPKLQELCALAASHEGGSAVCQVASELFPKGFTVGGSEAAILRLKDLADQAGALQAKVLRTYGAFHTPLMAPAQYKLDKALDEMLPRMKPPRCTVYMNAMATAMKVGTPPAQLVELLKKQLTSTVLWEPSVRSMIKDGVTQFFEVGPMKTLKATMKRIDSKTWNCTTNVEV